MLIIFLLHKLDLNTQNLTTQDNAKLILIKSKYVHCKNKLYLLGINC